MALKPSTHRAEVVALSQAHPVENADNILRVDVFGGFPCVVRKAEWEPGKLWVYVQPDSLVSTSRPEFSFLLHDKQQHVYADGTVRITARKFRQQISMGLLIPAPPGAKEGDDLSSHYGIEHWQPQKPKGEPYTAPKSLKGKWVGIILRRSNKYGEAPPFDVPHYDIEAVRRMPDALENKLVVYTEKLHGMAAAYCWHSRGWLHRLLRPMQEQDLRIRSRTVWRRPSHAGHYAEAVSEAMRSFLGENPHLVLMGEIVGPKIQDGYDYGCTKPTFYAYDLWDRVTKSFLGFNLFAELVQRAEIRTVPILSIGYYNFERAQELAEGYTTIPLFVDGTRHFREGVVIRSVDPAPIRQLKLISNQFYLGQKS